MTNYKIYHTMREACTAKARELLETGEVEGVADYGAGGMQLYISPDEKLAKKNSLIFDLISVEGIFFYIGFLKK